MILNMKLLTIKWSLGILINEWLRAGKQNVFRVDSPLWIFKAWCLSIVHPPSLEAVVSYPWRTAVLFSHKIRSGHDSYSKPTETKQRSKGRVHALHVFWIKITKKIIIDHIPLTKSFRQAIDLLAVDISFVPHEIIWEVGGCRKPLSEQSAFHSHHEVNLHQVERNCGVGEGHSQYRLVSWSPAA